MKINKLSCLFLLFYFTSFIHPQEVPTNNPSEQTDLISIATAILQNKNSFSDDLNYLSTYAYWHGSGWNHDYYSNFTMKEGLISQFWQVSYDTAQIWNFALDFFDGNYTDQNAITIQIASDLKQAQVNDSNATIIVPSLRIEIYDYPLGTSPYNCYADLYVYLLDKATKQPPQTFDENNLKAYSQQIRLVSSTCLLEFTTTLFHDTYYVNISQEDLYLLVIGSIVYLIASLSSMYIRKPNKRKVSSGTLRWMIFFNFYMISYLITWFSRINIESEILYYFIPLLVAVLVDFLKHLIELCYNDKGCCWCVFFGPILSFILVNIPQVGTYCGNLLSCLYLLPQVLLKYKERHERYKHLTGFEIGNWICISLWVVYLDFYPNNVFLSSPKPTLVFLHLTTVLVQLSILVYLQFAVERNKIHKYTFAVKDPKDQENLLEEQCAICMGELGINSSDDKLYKTPCGHLFHSHCLKEWGDKKLQCPCCRTELPTFVYPIE